MIARLKLRIVEAAIELLILLVMGREESGRHPHYVRGDDGSES